MRDCAKIRHYLNDLTEEQEDRILTCKMGQAPRYVRPDGCRCLCGTVDDYRVVAGGSFPQAHDRHRGNRSLFEPEAYIWGIGSHFDALCARFGDERIGAAIRNRILSNRTRRTLRNAPVREPETVA